MKSEETLPNEARVAILGRASTETEGRFTHRITSSIGVLQIKEKHGNGKTASDVIFIVD